MEKEGRHMSKVIIEINEERIEIEMTIAQIIKLARMALQDDKEPSNQREVVYIPYCVPVPSPLNPPYIVTCSSTPEKVGRQ